jgi:uncharacterized protein (TIGR03083 family)
LREVWLERDGVRLRCLEWGPERGREPDLFLLHGLSSNALYWTRLAARLPDRRLVALDQRSHGRSDAPATGYRMEALVEDAAHAVRELGLGRPVVVGHSWGATVALELVATHPELASGLGFVDGPGAPMSARLSWEDAARLMQPPLPRFARLDEAHEDVRRYLRDAWDEDLRDYAEGRARSEGSAFVLTLTAPVRLEILKELYAFHPELLWPRVEVPILLAVAGAPGPMLEWKRRTVEAVREQAPGAVVRWYDSDHDVPLIRPAELGEDLERLCMRAAWRELARELAELGELGGGAGGWGAPSGVGEWSRRELLAHLSSTQAALPAIARSSSAAGAGSAAGSGGGTPFDPDRWNASQLRKRAEAAPDQLLEEFMSGTADLEAALAEAGLEAPVTIGTYEGRPLAEAMEGMLGHQRGHLEELRAAVGA